MTCSPLAVGQTCKYFRAIKSAIVRKSWFGCWTVFITKLSCCHSDNPQMRVARTVAISIEVVWTHKQSAIWKKLDGLIGTDIRFLDPVAAVHFARSSTSKKEAKSRSRIVWECIIIGGCYMFLTHCFHQTDTLRLCTMAIDLWCNFNSRIALLGYKCSWLTNFPVNGVHEKGSSLICVQLLWTNTAWHHHERHDVWRVLSAALFLLPEIQTVRCNLIFASFRQNNAPNQFISVITYGSRVLFLIIYWGPSSAPG